MGVEDEVRRLRALGLDVTVGRAPRLPVEPPRPTDSEDLFTRRLIDLAHAHGWLAYHPLPLKSGKGWRTGTQGDDGFPDLVLARAGRVLLAELKVGDNQPTPNQRRWVTEAGASIWRPEDWQLIVSTLEDRP